MHDMNKRGTCLVMLTLVAGRSWGASFGTLDNGQVESQATICFAVGSRASLTGLDDFQLTPVSTDGAAGSVYVGGDMFNLESNAPMRVMVETSELINGSSSVPSTYEIDGSAGQYLTPGTGIHNAEHRLDAKVQLGRISRQAAGEYSGVVTLTVIPEMGDAGCGERTQTFRSEDGWMTLAFEDRFPSLGDADYNDMVVRYHIEEKYNAQRQLETVTIDFDPLARGASYNHAMYLSLDGIIEKSKNILSQTSPAFLGDALINVEYTREDGSTRTYYNIDKEDNITLFNNTRAVLDGYANVFPDQEWTEAKYTTRINITLANPELNIFGERNYESLFYYRPYLHVMNTNKDIDVAIINPNDGMISLNGSPFGLVVPGTWEWPLEGINIEKAYPYFSAYKSWFSGLTTELSPEAAYWYKYPASSDLVYNLDEQLQTP